MKWEIRERILRLRNGMPHSELEERSETIRGNLFGTPEFRNAGTILFYASIGSEVKTESMIKEAMELGKRVAVPVADAEKDALEAVEVKDCKRDLAPGTFGIPEPKKVSGHEVPTEKIGLVIVPGIAFDRFGTRIGYGRGFYDRLLPLTRKAGTLGLAYDFQLVPYIPGEGHDVRVRKIVTESAVVKT